mmetsp:Transcript_34237/g.84176  ORF Transcript_34237/g.84176 Transcript_34237/m.84176 type:complete len:206 (+) Transcript_34237:4112-4729(+)
MPFPEPSQSCSLTGASRTFLVPICPSMKKIHSLVISLYCPATCLQTLSSFGRYLSSRKSDRSASTLYEEARDCARYISKQRNVSSSYPTKRYPPQPPWHCMCLYHAVKVAPVPFHVGILDRYREKDRTGVGGVSLYGPSSSCVYSLPGFAGSGCTVRLTTISSEGAEGEGVRTVVLSTSPAVSRMLLRSDSFCRISEDFVTVSLT